MNSKLREKTIKLRLINELSYSEIRKRLGVPKSTLSYWLREFPLSQEKIVELKRKGWKNSEAGREIFRNSMRQKRKIQEKKIYDFYYKKLANLSKKSLFIAGLMLYLGEGDKKNYTRIALSNTDPRIILFFIKWLEDFLNAKKEETKIQLHLYENMDLEKEKEFWQNKLCLPNFQFYKSSIRKIKKSSFSYKESFRHGTVTLYLLGVERKRKLMMAIKAFIDLYIEK